MLQIVIYRLGEKYYETFIDVRRYFFSGDNIMKKSLFNAIALLVHVLFVSDFAFAVVLPEPSSVDGIATYIEWNTPGVDLDLRVINPQGKRCDWRNKKTDWGCVYDHDSRGSGSKPYSEQATVTLAQLEANPGEYRVEVEYYSGKVANVPVTLHFFSHGQFLGSGTYTIPSAGRSIVVWKGFIGDITNNRLDVIALDQNDYSFTVNGKNYAVGGCVPTTYAMMYDYMAKSKGLTPVSPSNAIETLLNVYSRNGVLEPPSDSTGVNVTSDRFIDDLINLNLTFKSCSQSIGYGVKLKREDTTGWNSSTFMNKVKDNIDSKKPIAISVNVFTKGDKEVNGMDVYHFRGGHHMLVTGYDLQSNSIYANDTWGNTYYTWQRIQPEEGMFLSKGPYVAEMLYPANTVMFKDEQSNVIVLREHAAAFNTPESISTYDRIGGCMAHAPTVDKNTLFALLSENTQLPNCPFM